MDLRKLGYLGEGGGRRERFDLKEQQEVPAAACLCDRRERDSPHRWASGISFLRFVLSSCWQPLACHSVGDMPPSHPELCSKTRKNSTGTFLPNSLQDGSPDINSPMRICSCGSTISSDSLLGYVI